MVTWRKRGFRDSCLEKETIKAAQINTARCQGQFPAILWECRAAGPVFRALAWGADAAQAVQESSREPTEPAGTARGACEGTGDSSSGEPCPLLHPHRSARPRGCSDGLLPSHTAPLLPRAEASYNKTITSPCVSRVYQTFSASLSIFTGNHFSSCTCPAIY